MADLFDSLDPCHGSHRFLAEELLQPGSSRCDATRTNMFTNHISQTVVLNSPDIPLVFTRFENKFGSYTSAIIKTLPHECQVYALFEKNSIQNVLVLYYPEIKYFDIHFVKPVKHLTETYGYLLDTNYAKTLKVDDVIPPESIIQNWPCTDEYGNFQYGRNLRTLYAAIEGLTYDDGIIASERAAKILSHTSVEEIEIAINLNDILINIYGDENCYKSFPNPGEMIKNGILAARRRIHKDTLARDLSIWELLRINYESDIIYYVEGCVMDIEVFSNIELDENGEGTTNNYAIQPQLKELIQSNNNFYKFILETLTPIVKNEEGYTYSDDLGFWYYRAMSIKDNKWTRENKKFDGVILKFIVAKNSPAVPGSKITNRFGGKGVISTIIPDHLMPYCEDDHSERADIVINCLGVNNRLNIAQLWESELNYLSHELIKKLKTDSESIDFSISCLSEFLRLVNPVQQEFFDKLDYDLKCSFTNEVLDYGYIPIHQPPFYGLVTLENLYECYRVFDIKPCVLAGVEDPVILGNNYYIKLRHEPSGKFSARSASSTNMSGVPTKKSQAVRSRTKPYADTPIRIGEQECDNMLLTKQSDELQRFFRMYATDNDARELLIKTLLTKENVEGGSRIDIPEVNNSRPVAGFRAMLEYIGLEIKSTKE